jgi:hypothetical protein
MLTTFLFSIALSFSILLGWAVILGLHWLIYWTFRPEPSGWPGRLLYVSTVIWMSPLTMTQRVWNWAAPEYSK